MSSRPRPNILLITTDTQRWDTLRCMGNPNAISPNLDQLTAEGVLFQNAHTSQSMKGTDAEQRLGACAEKIDSLPIIVDTQVS